MNFNLNCFLFACVWRQISGELDGKMPSTKPTALRFYGSNGVTVSGITIQNSPQTHLKFDDCTGVQISNFVASSPSDSPNTDGIHLQNSQDVVISAATLACGDDCVSIQTGCSNVYIHDVKCGPGHGISIGGLGKDRTKACVSNITVRDVNLQSTLTGVRIKTWQGGSGSVKQVTFSDIQVSEVETPIMIDQFYCDKGHCSNQSSAVEVSEINYVNIRGTYTVQPVHFACSDSLPCSGVSLSTIELQSVKENHPLSGPFCWETYGELKIFYQLNHQLVVWRVGNHPTLELNPVPILVDEYPISVRSSYMISRNIRFGAFSYNMFQIGTKCIVICCLQEVMFTRQCR
ncbi:hypothetical protein ES319_D07G252200v1 [Gossypium barbadense]|uniref:Polygalacturonase n=1 Tax=Gossypium barbadense TaxID=3634 RepID=A0A5J5QWI7_GOSBA|nr:hypothetical protein ES319_D07G252200v1 [Gossypium barbadense]